MDYYCVYCNVRLKRRQRKFCSNSCKCKQFYKEHPDKCNTWTKTHKKPKVNNVCLTCGTACGRKRYCSKECRPIRIPIMEYWNGIERINSKCKICNGTIFIPHVHHINGNHSDNRMENLLVVCPSCHCKIHNRKSKEKRSEKEINKRLEPYRKILNV